MLIKEKLMPEPLTCHLANITALFCTGIDRPGADIVVSDVAELGGRR